MSGFLDELERELLAAHPRRRRARARAAAGRAAGALALVAIVAVAALFVVSVGREGPGGGTASPAPSDAPGPAPAPLPSTASTTPAEPMPSLAPGSIAVLNGTPRPELGVGVANFIRPRYDVGYVGEGARREGTRTVVFYAPGFKRAAELVAQDLGASLTTMDATARNTGRGADVVVEVGRDIRAAGAATLHAPRDTAPRGDLLTLRYADRTAVTMTPELSSGRRYAAWATRSGARPRFLGFLPEVRSGRKTVVTFAIRRRAVRDRRLIVTRQRTARRPRSPGPTLLTADLPR